jgi:hypothetical protein
MYIAAFVLTISLLLCENRRLARACHYPQCLILAEERWTLSSVLRGHKNYSREIITGVGGEMIAVPSGERLKGPGDSRNW